MVFDEEREDLFNFILSDFSESDKAYLRKRVEEVLSSDEISFRGRAICSFIPASIFLLAKCPANADVPLSIAEISKRVDGWLEVSRNERSRFYSHKVLKTWKKTLTYLKRLGIFDVCRVTPRTIIRLRFGDAIEGWNPTLRYDLNEIMKLVDGILGGEETRLQTMGKNPYTIAASVCYIIGLLKGYNFTQNYVSNQFNVTKGALRNRYFALTGSTSFHYGNHQNTKERLDFIRRKIGETV